MFSKHETRSTKLETNSNVQKNRKFHTTQTASGVLIFFGFGLIVSDFVLRIMSR